MARGVNQIARDCGYAPQHVSRLLKEGLTEKQIRERAKVRGVAQRPRAAAVPERGKAMIAAKEDRAHRGKSGETMVEASLRKEVALADQRELELQIRRGEMVPRHLMKEWIADAFLGAKDVLLKMGPELKDQLAAETDPARIETMITDEIETALHFLVELTRKLADEPQSAAA